MDLSSEIIGWKFLQDYKYFVYSPYSLNFAFKQNGLYSIPNQNHEIKNTLHYFFFDFIDYYFTL